MRLDFRPQSPEFADELRTRYDPTIPTVSSTIDDNQLHVWPDFFKRFQSRPYRIEDPDDAKHRHFHSRCSLGSDYQRIVGAIQGGQCESVNLRIRETALGPSLNVAAEGGGSPGGTKLRICVRLTHSRSRSLACCS
jgi:hypothetical protein